ncbi:hypothetical protein JCM3765_007676 [Sporobolomyces pararoseus]
MPSPSTLLPLLLSLTLLSTARTHPKRYEDASLGGHFVDFATYDPSQQTPEQFLNAYQYIISDYTVGEYTDTTIPHIFEKPNVDIVDGALTLRARGQPGYEVVSSSQIQSLDRFTFGTLETFAKATPTKGVCQGIFFYDDDNHEVDIELLSDYYETGYLDQISPGVQFTNQPLIPFEPSTTEGLPFGFDPTADFHNYTIKWTPTETEFFVDGIFKTSLSENVPATPAFIIYNNWSNGNPGWSSGPPREDATFSIKSIKFAPL